MTSVLYDIADFIVDHIGYYVAFVVPFTLCILIILRQIYLMRIDLVVVAGILAIAPMFTPFATDLAGLPFFTWLNHDLQLNQTLKVAAVVLIALFSISMFAGGFTYIPAARTGSLGRRVTFSPAGCDLCHVRKFCALFFIFRAGDDFNEWLW